MEYQFVNPEPLAKDALTEEAVRFEREAYVLECDHERLQRVAKQLGADATGIAGQIDHTRRDAEFARAKANAWIAQAEVTEGDVTEIHRKFLIDWTQSIEADHARNAAIAQAQEVIGESPEDLSRQVLALEAAHDVAIERLDALGGWAEPPEPDDPEGDPQPVPDPTPDPSEPGAEEEVPEEQYATVAQS